MLITSLAESVIVIGCPFLRIYCQRLTICGSSNCEINVFYSLKFCRFGGPENHELAPINECCPSSESDISCKSETESWGGGRQTPPSLVEQCYKDLSLPFSDSEPDIDFDENTEVNSSPKIIAKL